MKTMILWAALLAAISAQAQLTEDFSDGNFTQNPTWTGNFHSWTVTPTGALQSAHTTANSSFYLSTPLNTSGPMEWNFALRLAFNPSSANYVDVYLRASSAELSLSTTSAYYVRIGGTEDEICLFRRDVFGNITRIIDGPDGITDRSDNPLRIRVVRTDAGQFHLFADPSGTGLTYQPQGWVTDASLPLAGFFGILARQSTSSFFGKHFFDDIRVTPYIQDVDAPRIVQAKVIAYNQVDVYFSEAVLEADAEDVNHYTIPGMGHPASAVVDNSNYSLVHLSVNGAFTTYQPYTIEGEGLQDYWGNWDATSLVFEWRPVKRFDVVIQELMAQPSPSQGLPETEWVELRNVSGQSVELGGWRLQSGTSTSAFFPPLTLPPDSILIVSSNSGATLLAGQGKTIGLGAFPSLPNAGAVLSLVNREGMTIHALEYSDRWYGGGAKAGGGWSLEMIDPRQPCTGGSNWAPSRNASGGTPGKRNSVEAVRNDSLPPRLLRSFSADSLSVLLVFDEPVDSADAALLTRYRLEPAIPILNAEAQKPLFRNVMLRLAAPMEAGRIYALVVNGLPDCKGNRLTEQRAPAGRAREAREGEVVINEILFNPKPNGSDYLELLNRSEGIIDARSLYLSNRNGNGALVNTRRITEEPLALYPDEYLLLTEDVFALNRDYLVKAPERVLTVAALPSLPDDSGTIVLTTPGAHTDELHYSRKWHFPLITDDEGVSLERLDPGGPSNEAGNWHSAASSAGWGTPGYANSQLRKSFLEGSLTIEPSVLSPDNDGYQDLLFIQATFDAPGFVVNISIFNERGQPVRRLVQSALAGARNTWTWNGLDDQNRPLPIGAYVVLVDVIHTEGKREVWKKAVTLIRRIGLP